MKASFPKIVPVGLSLAAMIVAEPAPIQAQNLEVAVYADTLATDLSIELQPYQPQDVYIVAKIDTGTLNLEAWDGRLTGAIANGSNGLFLLSTTLHPTTATNLGTSLEPIVGLGGCETVTSSQPLVLATLSIMCDTNYSDGRIIFTGRGTSTTAAYASCGGSQAQAAFGNDLEVLNGSSSKTAAKQTLSWNHKEFPPQTWDVIAGIGTVSDYKTPISHPHTEALRSHIVLTVEQALVGAPGSQITLMASGAVFERDGRTMIYRSPSVEIIYPKIGSRILFVAATRPQEYWNYFEDKTDGLPVLYFARFLVGESISDAEPLYKQARTSIPRNAEGPFFKNGGFDSALLEEILEPDGRALGEFVQSLQKHYQGK